MQSEKLGTDNSREPPEVPALMIKTAFKRSLSLLYARQAGLELKPGVRCGETGRHEGAQLGKNDQYRVWSTDTEPSVPSFGDYHVTLLSVTILQI
jgi:hypothetical protein